MYPTLATISSKLKYFGLPDSVSVYLAVGGGTNSIEKNGPSLWNIININWNEIIFKSFSILFPLLLITIKY